MPGAFSWWSRWSAVALALALVGPSPALAAPEADPEAEARALHDDGQARFDTADYAGAIESWTRAYAALPDRPESAAMRPYILYNIATARERAYDVYGDVAHLKQARFLLLEFDSAIDRIYDDPAEAAAERERVRARVSQLDARIAEHERAPAGDDDPETVFGAAQDPAPGTTEPQTPPQTPPSRERAKPDGRLVAGAVLLGLGGAAAVVSLSGVIIGNAANDIGGLQDDDFAGREQKFSRGRAGNGMAIGGAIAAPLLLGAGVVLVVLAKRRPRQDARAARVRGSLTPQGLGLRF